MQYLFNGEYSTEQEVINYAQLLIDEIDFNPEIDLTINEAIQIIREEGGKVECLGKSYNENH